MEYLVTSAEMKQYDQNCMEKLGMGAMVLMERAALETFYAIKEKGLVIAGKKALILAGYGNNGGDGLALARLLIDAGMDPFVWLVGEEAKATVQWKEQKKILDAAYSVRFGKNPEDAAYTVIIDALFGVGLSGDLEGPWAKAIDQANAMDGYKVAMDLPSGISADSGAVLGHAFRADLTVTYGFRKLGLFLYPGKEYAGEVRLAPVGITERSFFGKEPERFTLTQPLQSLLPVRAPDGNKGTFGKALIIAGSVGVSGAASLCARACFRMGAGMVKILTVPENRAILQENLPEAMVGSCLDEEEVKGSLSWCSVICIGPGIGQTKESLAALREVLTAPEGAKKPLVMDADALNLLGGCEELRYVVKTCGKHGLVIVLTPHPGEMRRLIRAIDPEEANLSAKEFAAKLPELGKRLSKEWNVITVAKDAVTSVSCPGKPTYVNLSGCSAMATAGSGDVLAGIITAFLCQTRRETFPEVTAPASCEEEAFRKAFFEAVCKAVRVHGLLGEEAAGRSPYGEHGVMAGDLIFEDDLTKLTKLWRL